MTGGIGMPPVSWPSPARGDHRDARDGVQARRGPLAAVARRQPRPQRTGQAEKAKARSARTIPMSSRLKGMLERRKREPAGEPFGREVYVFGDSFGRRIKSVQTAWRNALPQQRPPPGAASRDAAVRGVEGARGVAAAPVARTDFAYFWACPDVEHRGERQGSEGERSLVRKRGFEPRWACAH